jgi:hypothetical protein
MGAGMSRVLLVALAAFLSWYGPLAAAPNEARHQEMKRLAAAYFKFIDTDDFKRSGFANASRKRWSDDIDVVYKDDDYGRFLLIECGVTAIDLYLVAADVVMKASDPNASRRRLNTESAYRECFGLKGGAAAPASPASGLTEQTIQCGIEQAKLVPPSPDAPSLMSEPERLAFKKEYDAWQLEESKHYQKCITPQQIGVLGQANWEIPWAEGICGGRRHPKWSKLFDATGNAYLTEFVEAERTYRMANVSRIQAASADKTSAIARNFCTQIIEKYGPKGSHWRSLYLP